MYEQSLVKTITPIKENVIKKNNRYKKWEYGYNKEYDVVIISKNGTIGEVIEMQNLAIALPAVPKEVQNTDNKWVAEDYPKDLKNIKSIFDWETYSKEFKSKWYPYIDK